MVHLITAQHLTKVYRIAKPQQGRFAAVRALFHSEYIEKRAVDDVSFTIDDGELVGYIGPNGAGKSTTIKMLSGILTPTSGTVRVNGLDPCRQRREHARNIGVVFGQKTSLWWDVPVIDSFKLLKEMYRVPDALFNKNLDAYVGMLEMEGFINQPVRQLSLGQRMRADLAAALLHDPSILFLDEPTIGVDVVAKEKLRRFIIDINKERGVTALLTTHDMVDMEKLVSRVIVIGAGRIAYDGTIYGLREKYGQERRINVTFAEAAPSIDIPGMTEVARSPFHISYAFDQHKLPAGKALALLTEQPYTIRDIAIQEADIEDIIRSLYTSKGGDGK